MTPAQAELLERIASFDIDGGSVGLPFAARLARENGWSRSYADRVIAEYKRFVFLAMVSDTPVCPSEDVDAAWHLHLTYTRSYWKRFCDGVLGRPLHHEPTKGGPAEHEKHLDMYARTLARYRECFGRDAPGDVWTPAGARFGEDLAHRSVNTARNWVIPKAPVRQAVKFAALFAAVAVFVPGCNGGLNPFNLVGTEFLAFLIPMLIGAMCLGRTLMSMRRGRQPDESEGEPVLGWDRIAYLAGGPARLTTATIARLTARDAASLMGDKLHPVGSLPEDATAVERAVFQALPVANEKETLAPIAKNLDAVFADEARALERDGYLMSTTAKVGAWVLGILPLMVVLLGFALPRLGMGIINNKPVQYLVITSLVGSVVGLIVVSAGVARLTRRGEHALVKLKESNRRLLAGTSWNGAHDASMAVALFGPMVLAGSSLAMLHDWYPRSAAASTSSGCGTAGCGTGGCGGGGGGCSGGGGGCGGGGCGGCGGGGGGGD